MMRLFATVGILAFALEAVAGAGASTPFGSASAAGGSACAVVAVVGGGGSAEVSTGGTAAGLIGSGCCCAVFLKVGKLIAPNEPQPASARQSATMARRFSSILGVLFLGVARIWWAAIR